VSRYGASIVLYTKVDAQCDKPATDDRSKSLAKFKVQSLEKVIEVKVKAFIL